MCEDKYFLVTIQNSSEDGIQPPKSFLAAGSPADFVEELRMGHQVALLNQLEISEKDHYEYLRDGSFANGKDLI